MSYVVEEKIRQLSELVQDELLRLEQLFQEKGLELKYLDQYHGYAQSGENNLYVKHYIHSASCFDFNIILAIPNCTSMEGWCVCVQQSISGRGLYLFEDRICSSLNATFDVMTYSDFLHKIDADVFDMMYLDDKLICSWPNRLSHLKGMSLRKCLDLAKGGFKCH